MLPSLTLRGALVRTLSDAVDAGRAVLLTEGEAPTWGDLPIRCPDAVRALPIGDRANVALAVGMSWGGRPVVMELGATGRLPAVIEGLAEAARAPEDFRARIVVRVPLGGEGGGLDGPWLDLLASVPDLAVLVPRDASTGARLLRGALAHPGPTVLLEDRGLVGSSGRLDEVVTAPGHAEVVRSGHDVAILAWGAGVAAALEVADALRLLGVDAAVADVVSLAPIDGDTLGELARDVGRVVVLAPPDGRDLAMAERVARAVSAVSFLYLEAPVRALVRRDDPKPTAAAILRAVDLEEDR